MTTTPRYSPRRVPGFLTCLFIACSAAKLQATVILPSLPVGSQYQLIFVTLGDNPGQSADIATYNAFVATEATLSPSIAALDAEWHAVVSTVTVPAIVNALNDGLSVYNTQGILVANAATGIYNGSLLSPVQYTQFGNARSSQVWTGATSIGGIPDNPMGGAVCVLGDSSATGANWISGGATFSGNFFPLYALSGPITVVPEPSSIILIAFGALALSAFSRRLRRLAS